MLLPSVTFVLAAVLAAGAPTCNRTTSASTRGHTKSSSISAVQGTRHTRTSTTATSSSTSGVQADYDVSPSSSRTKNSSSISVTASSVSATSTASANSSGSWYQLGMDATFLYDLDVLPDTPTVTTKTGLVLNELVYITDMEGASADYISGLHDQGKKVICYFSAGSWESYRSDAGDFDPACYCGAGVSTTSDGCSSDANKLDGWDEWWLDIHDASCIANVESVMTGRIQSAKDKGCDGVDPDNVDSYENSQQFGTTAEDEYNYLKWLSDTAHGLGLAIDLKNAGGLLEDYSDLVDDFDFVVIESCYEYDECDIYEPFTKAGKPQIRIEYGDGTKTCPSLEDGQRLLVYSENDLNADLIALDCQS